MRRALLNAIRGAMGRAKKPPKLPPRGAPALKDEIDEHTNWIKAAREEMGGLDYTDGARLNAAINRRQEALRKAKQAARHNPIDAELDRPMSAVKVRRRYRSPD